MRTLIKITTLTALLLCSFNLSAQILDKFNEVKGKAYEKKVNKSPAKDEIIQLDKALEELERFTDWTGSGIYKANSPAPWDYRGTYTPNNQYTKFVKNYLLAKEMIPLIKEKDPDWKIEEQEERFAPFPDKYEEAIKLQKKYEGLEASHESYDKLYEEKIEELSGSWQRCGYSDSRRMNAEERLRAARDFNSFVLGTEEGDFNWKQLEADIPKVREITAAYKKEYELKDGDKPDYIDLYGLERIDINGESEYMGTNEYKEEFVSYFEDNDTEYDKEVTASGMPKKLKSSTADLAIAEAWLFIFPEDTELKEVHTKILNYRESLVSKYRSEIAVSDFHVEIINGVFFSDHPVIIGQETAADFKTEFKSTDPIYLTIYSTTKYNTCRQSLELYDSKMLKRLYLPYFPHGFKDDCVEMSSVFQATLVPASIEEAKPIYYSVINLLAHLKNFTDEQCELEIRDAKINIDMSGGNEKYQKLYDAAIKHRARTLSAPKAKSSFSLSLSKALAEENFNETLVKVIPTESDWSYKKNRYGVILSREIDVVLLFKDANGRCFMRNATVFQQKIDSGYKTPFFTDFSAVYLQEVNNDDTILHRAHGNDNGVYCRCQ